MDEDRMLTLFGRVAAPAGWGRTPKGLARAFSPPERRLAAPRRLMPPRAARGVEAASPAEAALVVSTDEREQEPLQRMAAGEVGVRDAPAPISGT
jgi:hypothetical protein